jgi:hypothetical protein
LEALGCTRKRKFAPDSSLEGTGFEPSVPRKAPVVVLVSVLVRADFSVSGESSGGDMSPSRNLACVTRYRRFESGFLQRRVFELSVPERELTAIGHAAGHSRTVVRFYAAILAGISQLAPSIHLWK